MVLAGFAVALQRNNSVKQSIIEDNLEIPADLDNVLSIDEIRTIASADTAEGVSIQGVELENEEGQVLYKVKYSDGTYRFYYAKTGEVYVRASTDEADVEEDIPSGFVAGISLQEARNIAVAQRPGKTVVKIELETENGVVVYSVRFSDGGRVDIDASSGQVLRVRQAEQIRTESNDDDDNDDQESSSDSGAVSDDDDSNDDVDDENDSDDNSGSDDKDREDDNSGSSSNSGSGSN